jgi:replicative DNA helicase
MNQGQPSSEDSEMGVLTSMLLGGPELIEEMAARLTPEHFHFPANALVFESMLAMHAARRPIDLITLTQWMRDQGNLADAGGPAYVSVLFGFVPTAANVAFYARNVIEKFILRRIIAVCTNASVRSYAQNEDPQTLLEEIQGDLIDIGQTESEANTLRHIKPDLMDGLDRIELRYKKRGKVDGLETGFTDLDRMLDGLKPACVYVVAGRPAMGKTSFGMAVAEHVALWNLQHAHDAFPPKQPGVCIFSVEMTREKLIDRIFASHAEVTREKIRRGMLAKGDFDRLNQTVRQFAEASIFLDASAALTIAKFRSQARRAVVRHKCGLIVIDYVQIMKGVSKRSRDNRALEIGEIMQGIAETAKTLMVPIVVLAQISRSGEERKESRPTMADLKESGTIEEWADFVGLLYRPAYYAKTDKQKEALAEKLECGIDDIDRHAELIVDKNRDGAVGTVKVRFVGEFTRFEDPSGRPLYSNNPELRQQTSEDSDE